MHRRTFKKDTPHVCSVEFKSIIPPPPLKWRYSGESVELIVNCIVNDLQIRKHKKIHDKNMNLKRIIVTAIPLFGSRLFKLHLFFVLLRK